MSRGRHTIRNQQLGGARNTGSRYHILELEKVAVFVKKTQNFIILAQITTHDGVNSTDAIRSRLWLLETLDSHEPFDE